MQYESICQQSIIEYCDLRKIHIFSIHNGGKRSAKEAHFLRLSGVKSGVPDMFVPIPNNQYHGLFIELKAGKNKPTENQKKWIEYLNLAGYLAVVCYGVDETIKTIEKYLKK